METGLLLGAQQALFPQDVGAGQGGVAAKVNLDGGGEPAQVEAVGPAQQEGGLGEVHLAPHVLQAAVIPRLGQQAHCRPVAGEGPGGEGVDLKDGCGQSTDP